MTTTNFIDDQTVIEASWLNDVDEAIYTTVPANQITVNNHIADTTDAHAASAITNTPAGAIAATTIQAAINELDTEKAPKDSPTFTTVVSVPIPTWAGSAVRLDQVSQYPSVSSHATTMDIFLAGGATVGVSGTTTVTAIPNCTAAQVGSTKTIIPSDAAGFSITASASLVVDGATSGTYLMPQNANIQIIATSVSTYKITTIEASGTFTGTLVGCTTNPTAVFRYKKSGGITSISQQTSLTGTSNSSGKSITGMPNALFPSVNTAFHVTTQDNGGAYVVSAASIGTNGTITLYKDPTGNAFTASGTFDMVTLTVSYPL